MDFSKSNENIETKIDKLNLVINSLIKDFEGSYVQNDKLGTISPINSFCEDLPSYQEFTSDMSFGSLTIPHDFLEKFQENLTEIDRLNMTIEDFLSTSLRSESPVFEIPITKEQILNLNKDTEKLISENASQGVIKVSQSYFIIETTDRPDKVIYFSDCIKSSNRADKNSETPNGLDNHTESNFIKTQADLELKNIAIKKKEDKLRSLEEDLGYKIQNVEKIKNDYMARLEELTAKEPGQPGLTDTIKFKSCPCKDSTAGICEFLSSKASYQDIGQILITLEKLIKEKALKKNGLEESKNDISSQFIKNRNTFNDNLCYLGRFSNKESYIVNYLKEQSNYQNLKFQEIKDYEKYLQEAWVESFGNDKAVSALQKASTKNFQISMQLKKEREALDEKIMRLQKLIEISKAENTRLEFHRKKIWNERQVLIKQQSEIEAAFEKISNYANIIS
jgi:hypothetical protein